MVATESKNLAMHDRMARLQQGIYTLAAPRKHCITSRISRFWPQPCMSRVCCNLLYTPHTNSRGDWFDPFAPVLRHLRRPLLEHCFRPAEHVVDCARLHSPGQDLRVS